MCILILFLLWLPSEIQNIAPKRSYFYGLSTLPNFFNKHIPKTNAVFLRNLHTNEKVALPYKNGFNTSSFLYSLIMQTHQSASYIVILRWGFNGKKIYGIWSLLILRFHCLNGGKLRPPLMIFIYTRMECIKDLQKNLFLVLHWAKRDR